jgi:hypothetical protein
LNKRSQNVEVSIDLLSPLNYCELIQNLIRRVLFLIIVTVQIWVADGKLPSLECLPSPGRQHYVNACTFTDQKSSNRDVSRIHMLPATVEGKVWKITSHMKSGVIYSGCTFDRLPTVAYRFFGQVVQLEVWRSTIKEINSSDFIHAGQVKKVIIKNSKIGKIEERAFEWMTSVEEITFENCKIGEISEDAFYGANSLKKVIFKDNTIDMSEEPELRMPNRKVKFINN